MNLLDSFNDFYSNLSSNGLFFFWIVVFLFVFLLFLLIVLYFKNKKLIKLIKEEKKETPITENINLPIKEEKQIETEEIKLIETDTDTPVKKIEMSEPIKLIEEKEETEKLEAPKEVKLIEEKGPYSKNILREMNTRMQTSPINIKREVQKEEKIDLKGIDYGEDSLSPLETMEDNYEVNDNMRFASEIIGRMEEEIKPSNIELTEYERKQEEEAIISYDELSKVKDKIYNITEDEETDEFIDELKIFRTDLD